MLLLLPGRHVAGHMAAGDQEDADLPEPELHPGGGRRRQWGQFSSMLSPRGDRWNVHSH